ncbi:hypothetical protein GCM10009552_15540 [Rothia nasimurium]|uniref:KTSC domain-containing protein n=1 Tax=Luteibacter anthropi TaxID=564369 RepID=A0A7X5ZIY7_9GAMM|nr:KTSC domain-containing protein [Luteibacter anthropi]NII07219.1 KTSC domain-containing protein [Luteibacter anthropi]
MFTNIEMVPVESSQIHSIGHDSGTSTLAIRFKNAKGEPSSLYHYDNFTDTDYIQFCSAESVGSHFGEFIKPAAEKYPFRKIDESAAPAIGTKTLRFEGHSDDTFGEYGVTNDDYDNCASSFAIEYLITSPSQPDAGLVVTGQHCPGGSGSWLIGVSNYDPDYSDRPLPRWPARFAPAADARYANEPALLIDVPSDFVLRCLQRDGADA